MAKRINSDRKGKEGEREWAKFLRAHGRPEARRGQQFSGGDDSPDVIDPGALEHWEVKRVENLSLYKAMDQAIKDAGSEKVPVVAHRRGQAKPGLPAPPWLVILRAEDYLMLRGWGQT